MTEQLHSMRQPTDRSEAFRLAFKCVWIYMVINLAALATVVLTLFLGDAPSTFMWVRAIILVAASPFLLSMTRMAGEGNDSIARRLKIVTTVLPIAVIMIDFIPGVAPVWYGAMQGLGALMLIPVAVICRRWTTG